LVSSAVSIFRIDNVNKSSVSGESM